MRKPKGHKKSCGCPFCKAYRRQKARRSPKKKYQKPRHHRRSRARKHKKTHSSGGYWIRF